MDTKNTTQEIIVDKTTRAKHTAIHSPLPWIIDEFVASQIRQPMLSKRRRIICPPDTDGINDAAFICRAVNSHAQLLEACKLARKDLDVIMPDELVTFFETTKQLLSKAIKLAERGEEGGI
jgi:hypothetical protein